MKYSCFTPESISECSEFYKCSAFWEVLISLQLQFTMVCTQSAKQQHPANTEQQPVGEEAKSQLSADLYPRDISYYLHFIGTINKEINCSSVHPLRVFHLFYGKSS